MHHTTDGGQHRGNQLLVAFLLAVAALALVSCEREVAPTTLTGLQGQDGAAPAPEAPAVAAALRRQLLPVEALPGGLAPAASQSLTNDEAAAFFADPAAARVSMTAAGRLGGAVAQYRRAGPVWTGDPRAAVVAVASSVARYRTAAAAELELRAPTLGAATQSLGLTMREVALAPLGEGSRAFRSVDDVDGATTYLVQVRQANLLHAVVVELAGGADDAGRLAQSLAQRQAATAVPRVLTEVSAEALPHVPRSTGTHGAALLPEAVRHG